MNAITEGQATPRHAPNPAEVYLATLSTPSSESSARGSLNMVCTVIGFDRYETPSPSARGGPLNISYRFFPWADLRAEHMVAIRAALVDARYAPASVNKTLTVVCGVLKQAWRMRLITRDEYETAIDVPMMPGDGLPLGAKRALSPEEFQRLLAAGKGQEQPWRVRNDALLLLLFMCGLRRGELVARPVGDGRKDDSQQVEHGSLQGADCLLG